MKNIKTETKPTTTTVIAWRNRKMKRYRVQVDNEAAVIIEASTAAEAQRFANTPGARNIIVRSMRGRLLRDATWREFPGDWDVSIYPE